MPKAKPGRPRLGKQLAVVIRATVPQDVREGLRKLGDGNISAGIRRLWEERK